MSRLLSVGTKCSIPRAPEGLVRRARLERLLANERRRSVTLISAPPGAGKTTLLTSWLSSGPVGPVAWVTLDERDGVGDRLAQLVAVALDRAGALAGHPRADEVHPTSGEDLLDVVFERLLRRGLPCVLVLDDLQEAHARPALRTLSRLVEQAPPLLDIVMATRADPPLGWGRLRLEGRLTQLRNEDLRFRPDEAAELFSHHGVHIGRDDTRVLCDRTEGWAAGLRLAACALQSDGEHRPFVLSASATQVAVSDYLLTEVLDRQDHAAQQFLLRTSVVDRLTPDLATALTDDARAGERLAGLERRGIFVVELDGDGNYRYHALFAALLRARLRLQGSDLVASLHRRAARWHLGHGLLEEAEAHARLAGEWYLAGRLTLDRWLDASLDGTAASDDLLRAVPPGVLLVTPELALVAAARACASGNRPEADRYRRVADHATVAGAERATTWGLARAVLDLEYGRAFGVSSRERHAARLLATIDAGAATARAHRLARLRGAEQDVDAGHLERAWPALEQLAGDPAAGAVGLQATALLALVAAVSGRLPRAEECVAAVLAGTPSGQGHPEATVAAHLSASLLRSQRAEPRLAAEALARAGTGELSCRVLQVVRGLAPAGRRPTRVDVASVVELPARAHPMVGPTLASLGILDMTDQRGRVRVHGGAGERALAAARRSSGSRHHLAMERLLAWLADQATLLPEPEAALAAHPRTLIEASLLCAAYTDERGDTAAARRHLLAALTLYEETGIRAPFHTHAQRAVALMRRYETELGAHRAAVVELVDRATGEEAPALVETLTERELEILHRLPSLMSNVEIAEGLHVSVNTVKTHLKAVYRKLGVEGRRQAVLRGRDLELI